jgi:hypothetical protein
VVVGPSGDLAIGAVPVSGVAVGSPVATMDELASKLTPLREKSRSTSSSSAPPQRPTNPGAEGIEVGKMNIGGPDRPRGKGDVAQVGSGPIGTGADGDGHGLGMRGVPLFASLEPLEPGDVLVLASRKTPAAKALPIVLAAKAPSAFAFEDTSKAPRSNAYRFGGPREAPVLDMIEAFDLELDPTKFIKPTGGLDRDALQAAVRAGAATKQARDEAKAKTSSYTLIAPFTVAVRSGVSIDLVVTTLDVLASQRISRIAVVGAVERSKSPYGRGK